jgi:predicted alpha/beta superfamily hydrolase
MKFSKPLNLVLTTILISIFSNSLHGQKLDPKERVTEPDHIISSEIMGKDYKLYISFPSGYSANDTIYYPVLYVLDGDIAFPFFSATRKLMDMDGEIENVIIVGIGSGLDFPSSIISRSYDLTPSQDTIYNNGFENQFGLPKGTVQTGGAPKFLKSITTEMIPFVDKHYKTTADRGIAGHSLGGLFASYCLLNSKDVFNKYGISSPSLWWDNEELLNQGYLQFTENETWNITPTKVFISVGGLEGSDMIPAMTNFSTSLKSAAYSNIDLTWKIFEDETHSSMIPAMFSRTLSVLYGKNQK